MSNVDHPQPQRRPRGRPRLPGLQLTCEQCGCTFRRSRGEHNQAMKRNCAHTFCGLSCAVSFNNSTPGRNAGRVRRAWRAANPEVMQAAHGVVNTRVRRGKLKKPDHCMSCGEKRRLDGHHEDYTDKAGVLWLCRSCHVRLHLERAT